MEDLKMMKDDYIREMIRFYREHGIVNDSIQRIDTMAHTAKNLCKIYKDCMDEEMGYSGAMNMNRSYGYNYSNGSMGMNDYSGASGRGSNANRDSMGRYSSGRYSGHHDMVSDLYEIMNRTSDMTTKNEIQNMINDMQQAR